MRRKLWYTLLILLLLSALSANCLQPETELPFEILFESKSTMSGGPPIPEPTFRVVTADSQIESLGFGHPSYLKDLDFERHFVIVAFHGLRNTSGYYIQITRIIQVGSVVTVTVVRGFSTEHAGRDKVVAPYCVVKVNKLSMPRRGELEFVFVEGEQTLARQTQVIP